jgi:hypothetical protein
MFVTITNLKKCFMWVCVYVHNAISIQISESRVLLRILEIPGLDLGLQIGYFD